MRHFGMIAAVSAVAITAGVVAASPSATAAVTGTAAGKATAMGIAAPRAAVLPRSRVPWARVGRGWELAQYAPGTSRKAYVYLISPFGTKYVMHVWPSRNTAPNLIDWSGDKRRALFALSGKAWQLTLRTGRLRSFHLAGYGSWPLGYTRPHGRHILGAASKGTMVVVARYSLAGRRLKVLDRALNSYFLPAGNGTRYVFTARKAMRLVSDRGTLIRSLAPGMSCLPHRWWNAATVLAACIEPHGIRRLWLVPLDGRRPTALTRPDDPHQPGGITYDAWLLSGRLYTQRSGQDGGSVISWQRPNGSSRPVKVPHAVVSAAVMTTYRGWMLVVGRESPPAGDSLFWFNPRTGAERWLLRPGRGGYGVDAVIPYYSRQNAG